MPAFLPHLLVTGAEGFIGRGLLERWLLPAAERGELQLTLTDRHVTQTPLPGVRVIEGDITDPTLLARVFEQPVDRVFHLAAIVSGQAERDYELGQQVNLQASLRGLELARRQWLQHQRRVRWIQASSIAVWGTGLPAQVDDHTPIHPELSYGAHKRMLELMMHDLSRRGELDGRCLRLSGVVVRPRAAGGALSGFNSDLIREPLQGREVVSPVRRDSCLWLCSRDTTVDQLWALSQIPEDTWRQRCAEHRSEGAVNAPTWPVQLDPLIAALSRIDPAAPARIRFDPAAPLQAQFGNWPVSVDFALARALGLPDDRLKYHDDLEHFVRASLVTAHFDTRKLAP
jgi:nucleoside-diphosphate-sugar epimerase